MPDLSLESLPEVFVSNVEMTKKISRYLKEGTLRKLSSRLYTKNLKDPPELIVRRNLWPIIGCFFPGALIADRTALENQPATDGSIFLISSKKRDIALPGITLRPRKGTHPLPSDRPFIGGLFLSSQARAFLENIRPSRTQKGVVSRTLSRQELEERLDTLLRRSGYEALNQLRDEARKIAKDLEFTKEFNQLEKLIGALLGTQSEKLESSLGQARQTGLPYDPMRLELFQLLHTELLKMAPVSRLAPPFDTKRLATLAFFESYFSNFIEGTEFEIEEAFNIIFKGRIPLERPQDAHDILGTYRIVSDTQEMSRIPKKFDMLVSLLKERHARIMEERPDKLPGEFKIVANRAGNTLFVAPELVMGTLQKGFELYQTIDAPFHRAIFIMFLVAEAHPFADGNGRVARIMMNAELVSANEQRMIIPTVYRNNYLSALKALSLNKIPEPLIRTLDFAQKYVASIDWSDFNRATEQLERTHAFMDPNIADSEGIRLRIE